MIRNFVPGSFDSPGSMMKNSFLPSASRYIYSGSRISCPGFSRYSSMVSMADTVSDRIRNRSSQDSFLSA